MAELSLQDRNVADDYQHTRTGQKRRANSPPPPPTHSNLSPASQALAWEHGLQRGIMELTGTRAPPHPRHQQASSGMSSVASSTIPQSYMSSNFNLSQPSTAATSYSDQLAPGAHLPPPDSGPAHSSTPLYQSVQPHSSSPLTQNMAAPPIPKRNPGHHILRVSGLWMCECCPKKPRKFDTEHELRSVVVTRGQPCWAFANDRRTDYMKWKSNIYVNSATIDSRTRTKLNAIKIRFI